MNKLASLPVTSLSSSGARLVAHTRETEQDLDLFDFFEAGDFAWIRNGAGLLARGVTTRIRAELVEDFLATTDVDDPLGLPGTSVIAYGALPFDPGGPRILTIPRRIRGRTSDGRGWVTDITFRGPENSERTRSSWEETGPCENDLAMSRDGDSDNHNIDDSSSEMISLDRTQWRSGVDAARAVIAAGKLEKMILARSEVLEADLPFDIARTLRLLHEAQSGCFCFATEGFLGASPELLIRRDGDEIFSQPMAGTAISVHDSALSHLQTSSKELWEHQLVVDAVMKELTTYCITRPTVDGPHPARFAHLAHLASTITGMLTSSAPGALGLALALHPTPAVAGTPREVALGLIHALEPGNRGRYAGPVGWVDGRGNGEFAVALRCAEISGRRARIFAGAGIVADSDADTEWDETEAKLVPMRNALLVD